MSVVAACAGCAALVGLADPGDPPDPGPADSAPDVTTGGEEAAPPDAGVVTNIGYGTGRA
jgi:hypothetical protein